MDYILKKLNRRIEYCERSALPDPELGVLYRAKIEYYLLFWLGYLWNRNQNLLDSDTRAYLLQQVQRPTIGTIVDLCRRLDVAKELFRNKDLAKVFNEWPALRNEALGHGYVFQDRTAAHLEQLQTLASTLDGAHTAAIPVNADLIAVERETPSLLSGTLYTSEGDYHPWSISKEALAACVGETYVQVADNTYRRLSPFITIKDEDGLYMFRSVKEPLTGTVLYNRILRTGTDVGDWPELANVDLEVEGVRRLTANKTVMNTFDPNYRHYIDVGLRRLVLDFVIKNSASVCATVWGHGGVGKTATVQSACEYLTSAGHPKAFDYVVFASAKDRAYNYLTGSIQAIEEASRVNTFDGIIRLTNRIILRSDDINAEHVRAIDGRLLLIIDDYETFPAEEKKLIEEFIKSLNINHHKVLITTRANLVIGEEIRCNELTPDQTQRFIVEVISAEFPSLNASAIDKQLLDAELLRDVHRVTNGRPLFIYQFAHVWMQSGGMPRALRAKISTSSAAIEFLYGRIFEYLTDTAKNIFVTLSLLASQEDLTGVVDKVRYVLNLEDDKDRFDAGVHELVKLRIVELLEGGFFQVYSREIFQIMGRYFQSREESSRGIWQQRFLQIGKDKTLENDRALLNYANAARYSRSEEEVNSSYRQILNRASASIRIKLQAAVNLASYFVLDRGNREAGVKVLEDYAHLFSGEPTFVKLRASFTWSPGSREKAVTVLADAIGHERAKSWSKNDLVEVLGLLLTYKSIYWLEKREAIKNQAALDEVGLIGKRREWGEQKKAFESIINRHGRQMTDLLKTVDVGALTAAARQNTVTGLLQLVEVCIRARRLDFGEEICEWVLKNVSHSFRNAFEDKLFRIRSYRRRDSIGRADIGGASVAGGWQRQR